MFYKVYTLENDLYVTKFNSDKTWLAIGPALVKFYKLEKLGLA